MAKLATSDFPILSPTVEGTWAPILLRPIIASPEQYVIAVVAVSALGFHIERANQFDRLECLFGDSAGDLIFVAEAAIDAFHRDVASRGREALTSFRPAFSGIELGEPRIGQGRSLEELARLWMTNLSSLYSNPSTDIGAELAVVGNQLPVPSRPVPLPNLVMDFVVQQRPALLQFFAPSVRRGSARRRARSVHGVMVDFAGPRLRANFGSLTPSGYVAAVDGIKRMLWDLKLDRDTRSGKDRFHQMLVQHIPETQLTSARHIERIRDGLKDLQEQAAREEIGLLPMTSIEQIGRHVLEFEEAA
jgi:hypothetical protein